MATSRSTFSKFTLKPSALSQHTANFNKILEQVPAPKIDSLDLVKPLDAHNVLKKAEANNALLSTIATNETGKDLKVDGTSENELSKKEQTDTVQRPFVFGEKLNDRVINVNATTANENGNEKTSTSTTAIATSSETTSKDKESEIACKPDMHRSSSASIWPDNESSNALASLNDESNDLNTLGKYNNCKLFILDQDSMGWHERGSGIMKLIDADDGKTCRMMMWTDKCFRLILNTKLFDKMQIDRATKKSIRFNALDSGSIRVFLAKMANPNDCDDLFDTLESRLALMKQRALKNSSSDSSLSSQNSNSKFETSLDEKQKNTIMKCSCDLNNENINVSETNEPISSSIHLYTYPNRSAKYLRNSKKTKFESHELLMDIIDEKNDNQILMTTSLKLAKIKCKNSHNNSLEFELDGDMLSINNVTTKPNVKFTVIVRDEKSATEFMNLYQKEPKLCDSNVNNDDDDEDADSINETSDEDDDNNVSNDDDDQDLDNGDDGNDEEDENGINEKDTNAENKQLDESDNEKTVAGSCGLANRKRKNDENNDLEENYSEKNKDESSSVECASDNKCIDENENEPKSDHLSQEIHLKKPKVDDQKE